MSIFAHAYDEKIDIYRCFFVAATFLLQVRQQSGYVLARRCAAVRQHADSEYEDCLFKERFGL